MKHLTAALKDLEAGRLSLALAHHEGYRSDNARAFGQIETLLDLMDKLLLPTLREVVRRRPGHLNETWVIESLHNVNRPENSMYVKGLETGMLTVVYTPNIWQALKFETEEAANRWYVNHTPGMKVKIQEMKL